MTAQQQARQQIHKLIQTYKNITPTDRKVMSESAVIHQFLDPFFQSLGWPVKNPERYKYELSTQAGRPDMILFPEAGGTIYVEAKRFGVIAELEQSRKSISGIVTPGQLGVSGMATDRTPEEQQAINYAFSNGGTWAILTNFERLRLFNARRDWLVLSFENPAAFLDEFDLLWELSYESILAGRLDALSNQRHREDVDTEYLAFINEWRQKLAQDILAHRTQNWWAFDDQGRVQLALLRSVVQRVLDRLVVVRFAEDHLIIPAGTLNALYELRRTNPYTFTLSQHLQQLYQRFDEFHNSALFARDLADQAVFSDEVLSGLVQKLYEARYRAMSADIMGNTYEQYLGKTLVLKTQQTSEVATADNLETRKKQGSYYTPQVIVRYLVDNSLGRYLYGTADGKPNGQPLPNESRKTAVSIQHLRVIDPACGSGGFLIYAYQVLADFYRAEIQRLEADQEARYNELVAQGVTSPLDIRIELTPFTAELDRLQEYPRLILETHLYGVDLDPQAAEIATVNLMFRAMADQRRTQKRLPLILNQNVKVGNALIGAMPGHPAFAERQAELLELRRLRQQLATEGSQAHSATLKQITAVADPLRQMLNQELANQFPDLEAIRPFHWAVEFPEVFLAPPSSLLPPPGFHILIGNPPWEILRPDLREYYAQFDANIESKLTRERAEARIEELNALQPDIWAGWQAQRARIEATAAYLRGCPDYTRQGKGDTATHKLFLERGYQLLADGGRLAFVIPSGIYTDLGTKELRQMLLDEGNIQYLFNFSNERFFFPHVHHSFKFTLLGAQKGHQTDGFWATFRFNPRVAVAPGELATFLSQPDNLIYIHNSAIARFSPDSLSLMEFQNKADYRVTETLYGERPLLSDKQENSWNVRLNREFDMTNDRHLFNVHAGPIAVYNGRMIHQFDAYYAPHEFWIAPEKTGDIAPTTREQISQYRLGYRRIARATDSRTLISAVIPPNTICDTVAVIENGEEPGKLTLYLSAVFNSLCLDYLLRQKVATTINMFYVYQLPVPRLTAESPFFLPIVHRAAALTCTTPAFAPLWQEVMGQPWPSPSLLSPPSSLLSLPSSLLSPTTDSAHRQKLRDELDAIIAHLYGLSRSAFAHILGTFPLVFPATPEGQAKKEALLTVYDGGKWGEGN